ncbi:MAG TPA: peptidylprolyl isomerase, partial [Planctomycetota bacterium]|nr:peptidylprolyl isomerase [Planctomycetota bacterium]
IDLAAFAQQTMAKAFPFDMAELTALLKDKKYAAVLDAIGTRAPAAAVLNAAAKHADLAAFCKTKLPEVRTNAKKAIMAQNWLFASALPRDEKANKEFQAELSISGMSLSPDQKSIVGILLGGEQLHRDHATAFVRSQLARTFLMEDLAAGKPPRIKELPKLIDDAKKEIVRDLESRYGKPEPPKADGTAQQPVRVANPASANDSDLTKNDPAIRALDAFIAGAKIDKTAEHWKRMLPQPPTLPFTATNDYFWHIDTECGPITLRYFPDASPQHVSSGLYLARLGFYDGLTFHRVIPGFMAQGGDPLANGQGGPGFRIPPEFKNGLLHGKAGILSMARSREPDSAGSQFMITFGPAPTLDNQYTVWGEVTSGMDTVKELEKKGTREHNGMLATPLKINKSWISVAPKGSTPEAEK